MINELVKSIFEKLKNEMKMNDDWKQRKPSLEVEWLVDFNDLFYLNFNDSKIVVYLE